MRNFFLIAIALMVASGAFAQRVKDQAKFDKDVDSLFFNRGYEFCAVETDSRGKETPVGNVAFYPASSSVNLPGNMKAESFNPESYFVVRTTAGWVAVFTVKQFGFYGDKASDGENSPFRCVLSVDKKGNGTLMMTTEFNNHSYPYVYNGYITSRGY